MVSDRFFSEAKLDDLFLPVAWGRAAALFLSRQCVPTDGIGGQKTRVAFAMLRLASPATNSEALSFVFGHQQ